MLEHSGAHVSLTVSIYGIFNYFRLNNEGLNEIDLHRTSSYSSASAPYYGLEAFGLVDFGSNIFIRSFLYSYSIEADHIIKFSGLGSRSLIIEI